MHNHHPLPATSFPGHRCASIVQDQDPVVAEPVIVLLKSVGVSGSGRVLAGMAHVTYALELNLPNLNGPLLLAKAAAELAIPEVRCRMASK